MLINDNWKIESNSLNIILYKKRTVTGKCPNSLNQTKTENIGKEIWETKAYFSNIKSALMRLVELELLTTELKDLKTIVIKIDELQNMILNLPASVIEIKPTKSHLE